MPVRTKELGQHVSSAVLTTLYTCPSDRTAIVKELLVGKTSTGARVCTVTVLRGAVAYIVAIVNLSNLGAQLERLERWTVLEPGDVLRTQMDTSTATVWASGTELVGVA